MKRIFSVIIVYIMALTLLCCMEHTSMNAKTVNESYDTNIVAFDTVVKEKCYVSFFNFEHKAPSFVIYKLYRGGGNVPRDGMSFHGRRKLPHFNYTNSGYDRGHLCPAEDFAYSKTLEKNTFYYHNALPQTPHLNRGIWKSYENKVRRVSQDDSLLIVCGAYGWNGLIPRQCFKVVYSLTNKKRLWCVIIDNDDICTQEIDNKSLIRQMDFERVNLLWKSH